MDPAAAAAAGGAVPVDDPEQQVEKIIHPTTLSSATSKPTSSIPEADEKGLTVEQTGSIDSDVPAHGDLEKGGDVAEEEEEAADPNVVDFDGPHDPAKAQNWTVKKKWLMISCLSIMTLVSPLASSMFAPGVPEVLQTFQSNSSILGSFVVSVYILGYAAGPLIIAPLSELYGRLWVYHITNILFVIFTIACAVSSSLNMLIGFRFLAGLFGSSTITMGAGTIADLFIQEERGVAVSLWSLGPLLGPVVGPVAGGFAAERIGWRWVFWIIAIAAGVVTCFFFVFVRESYAPIILARKAKQLRKETGNDKLRAKGQTDETAGQLFARAIIRPMKMLFTSPIVFLLSMFCALVYGYLYLLFTTITEVFLYDYHFNAGTVGLTYIGIGVGMFLGLGLVGATSDRILKKKAAKADGYLKPEYRLPFMVPGAVAVPVGLFIYGWSAQYHVHWFVPIFGTSFVGFGLISVFLASNTYLIDAFPMHAASASAAMAVLRSVLGALLPLAGPAMFSKLGLGWGSSVLGFIAVAFLPVPFAFLRYGEYLRTSPRFQLKL